MTTAHHLAFTQSIVETRGRVTTKTGGASSSFGPNARRYRRDTTSSHTRADGNASALRLDIKTTPTKKKAKTDPFGCPDPVTEAPVRRAKKRAAASTPKKAKKAKTLVGAKVNKKFKGYRSASGTEYFDGVIKSVEDGMCVIAWEDGEKTGMTEAAVQKILVV